MPDLGMLPLDKIYDQLTDAVSNEHGLEYQYRFANSDVRKDSDYRAYGRIMHGSNPNNESADNVTSCSSTAPLYKMLHYSQDAKIKIKNDPTRTITVSASETLKHQQEVELYYNEKVISKHEITEIQKSKLKAKVSHNNNKDLNLESKASYLVARGIVTEYITTDGTEVKNMQGKAEPLDRVVYYVCFPKLNSGTVDFATYCNSNGSIKDSVALKQKFKDIIAMQIKVAEKHKEALDIVTPNAFFAGLNNKDYNGLMVWTS